MRTAMSFHRPSCTQPVRAFSSALWPVLVLALAACGKPTGDSSGTSGGPGGGADTGDDGTNGPGTDPAPDDGATSDPTGDSGTDSEGGDTDTTGECHFLCEDLPDDGGYDCDVWEQDCEEGEKCMPWSSDGTTWNALKCTPVDANPKQPGDECVVEGNGASGIDDCDLGSMCWDVDPETNLGTCVAFCQGSEAAPTCDDPETNCVIANEGVLILCLPNCDPLVQDCPSGQACYPVYEGFNCAPDVSGADMGGYGDPCEYINVCDPGLFCASAEAVPGCPGSQGCCSEFCDLSAPDPNAACSGVADGQECTMWYDEGAAPPGFEDLGACVIPS
jgi:hypothetical protein